MQWQNQHSPAEQAYMYSLSNISNTQSYALSAILMYVHEDDILVITVEVMGYTSQRQMYYVTETVITWSECAALKHASQLSCYKYFTANQKD